MTAPCPTLGFTVDIDAAPDRAALFAELAALLETNDLTGTRRLPNRMIVTREGSQATVQDRDVVAAWAKHHTSAATILVSDITDLSHAA